MKKLNGVYVANVWFCSDLHLGHKNIGKFRAPLVNSTEENNNRIIRDWDNVVTKNDHVYVLGDWCFDLELIKTLNELKGKKFLVRGNHDQFDLGVYTKYFSNVYGLYKYKEFWLSHAPIHPDELRGKVNLHGHVHYQTVQLIKQEIDDLYDFRYFNCCPENLWPKYGRCLISLDEVRKYFNELRKS